MYDWRLPTVSVDVHGCAFSDRPVVIAYDARLEGKAMYIAVARQVLTLAPDYWSIVGRRLGNASELGRELDSMAYSVTQNGGREVLDELLKQHIFEK